MPEYTCICMCLVEEMEADNILDATRMAEQICTSKGFLYRECSSQEHN